MSDIGISVKRYKRLMRRIERKWVDDHPLLATRLMGLLLLRYVVETGEAGVAKSATSCEPVKGAAPSTEGGSVPGTLGDGATRSPKRRRKRPNSEVVAQEFGRM